MIAVEYKRRKYYRSATAAFKRVLNDLTKDFLSRCGDTIESIRNESEKPLRTEALEQALNKVYVTVGSDFAMTQMRAFRRGKKSVESDYWQYYFNDYARKNAGRKITWITNTTEQIFKSTVNQVIQDGADKSVYDLLKQIQSELNLSNQYRAERIARTEIIAASNAGQLSAARGAGIPLKKKWFPIIDSNSRDTHADMASHPAIGLDESFDVGGEKMQQPGEGSPENVINCRCAMDFIEEEQPELSGGMEI